MHTLGLCKNFESYFISYNILSLRKGDFQTAWYTALHIKWKILNVYPQLQFCMIYTWLHHTQFWHNRKYLQKQQYNTPVKGNETKKSIVTLSCSSILDCLGDYQSPLDLILRTLGWDYARLKHSSPVFSKLEKRKMEQMWEILPGQKNLLADWLGESTVRRGRSWRQ